MPGGLLCLLVVVCVATAARPRQFSRPSAVLAPDFARLAEVSRATGSYNDAVVAAKQYLASSISPNSRAVTACIKLYGAAALVDDAVEVLTIAKGKGVEINGFHYNACLQVCSKHRRHELALRLFDEMKRGGVEPDSFTLSTMACVYGDINDSSAIVSLFEDTPAKDRDPVFYCSVLSALEKCGQPEDCERVLTEMRSEGIPLSVNVYASMIRVFGQVDVEKSWRYYLELESTDDLSPNRVLLLNLIGILRAAGQSTRIAYLKDKYPELLKSSHSASSLSSSPAKKSFKEVIAGVKAGGSTAEAVEYADNWLQRQRRLTPGGVTSCITIYSLAKMPQKAIAVIDLMRARGEQPNIKHYNAVMSCCLKNELFDESLQVLNGIDSNVDKDEFTYGILLKMYEMKGDWVSALSLFESLDDLGITRTTVMHNTLISALGKANQTDQALLYYNALLSAGSADATSHFTMVSCLEKGGLYDKAAEIKAKFVNGSDSSFPKRYSEAGTLQQKLVQQEGGGLFRLLYSLGQLERCIEVLRECENDGVDPHPSHYLQIIKLCGETGNWTQALEIYEKIKAKSTNIDRRIVSFVLHILSNFPPYLQHFC